jgi:hypothetical protein
MKQNANQGLVTSPQAMTHSRANPTPSTPTRLEGGGLSSADELWLLRYVVTWLPERIYNDLSGGIPLAVLREIVERFVEEATEASAGEAFRKQWESLFA